MEQDMPIVTRKAWKLIWAVYFAIRKGISRGNFLVDLSTLMKHDKIAGKAAFHHLAFHRREFHDAAHGNVVFDRAAVAAAVEFVINSAAASPALPGFRASPMVRQLRITDSPFPLKGMEEEEDGRVDEAAEEFIMRFYRDLKMQNSTPYLGCF